MSVEVLVAAVNQDVEQLMERMGLETEAVIVNQCDRYEYQVFREEGRLVRCFSMAERGVGLSRNTALQRAKGEYCLFSDEDIVLHSGYERVILEAFAKNPDADGIAFNLRVCPERATYHNEDEGRIRWNNYGRYPTYAIAARRESLIRAGVSFSLLFGGGAPYSNGEDSLFLRDCLKAGLHLYRSTAEIGEEVYRESTWFHGYNEKFFRDRGVLYHYLYGLPAKLLGLRFLFVHREELCREIPLKQAYRWICEGVDEGRNARHNRPGRKSGK